MDLIQSVSSERFRESCWTRTQVRLRSLVPNGTKKKQKKQKKKHRLSQVPSKFPLFTGITFQVFVPSGPSEARLVRQRLAWFCVTDPGSVEFTHIVLLELTSSSRKLKSELISALKHDVRRSSDVV